MKTPEHKSINLSTTKFPISKWQILKITILLCFLSCEQFVDIAPPQTSLSGNTVFTNDANALSTLMGIYERMSKNDLGFASGSRSITLLTGLSSDELVNLSNDSKQAEIYTNQISTNNSITLSTWAELYEYIYATNAILEGINKSQTLTLSTREQIEGESKFLRAFFYFYLVNLFGDVPLVTQTDYTKNSSITRSPKSIIYNQIISDLNDAKTLLTNDYISEYRIRPNKNTASALLARVYLYSEDWTNAEDQATIVINNSGIYNMENDCNDVFLKESHEAIWQLQSVAPYYDTFDGVYFIFSSSKRGVALSDNLLNSFEPLDLRKQNWIGSRSINDITYYYPYKYKVRFPDTDIESEYLVTLRLAEQYLIRAEARAQQDNILGSKNDLNLVRNRAGLENITTDDKTLLLQFIEHENQVELFTEWGHRWLDLKRKNMADVVLKPVKGDNWQSTDVLYPIPQAERTKNPSLDPQNPGY